MFLFVLILAQVFWKCKHHHHVDNTIQSRPVSATTTVYEGRTKCVARRQPIKTTSWHYTDLLQPYRQFRITSLETITPFIVGFDL